MTYHQVKMPTEEQPNAAVWIVAIWIIAGLATLITGLTGIEGDLTQKAQAAIQGTDMSVDIHGRDVVLNGRAGSEEAIDEAMVRIASIEGVRQVTRGRLTVAFAPTQYRPPNMRAIIAESIVTLSGEMPGVRVANSIAQAAVDAFGRGKVYNEFTITSEVDWPEYLDHIDVVFPALVDLDEWTVVLADNTLDITGTGSEEQVALANSRLSDLAYDGLSINVGLTVEIDVARVLSSLLWGIEPFEGRSAVLTADGKERLQEAIQILDAFADTSVSIEAHTSDIGDETENLVLSQQRADAIRDFLVAGGISPDRLTAVGFGESRPIVSGSTAEDRAQNERIEFVVAAEEG